MKIQINVVDGDSSFQDQFDTQIEADTYKAQSCFSPAAVFTQSSVSTYSEDRQSVRLQEWPWSRQLEAIYDLNGRTPSDPTKWNAFLAFETQLRIDHPKDS